MESVTAVAETATINITVGNLRASSVKAIRAFLDAEFDFQGIAISILDIQLRPMPGGGLCVHLPTHKAPNGQTRSALKLPDELFEALGSAILEFLKDEMILAAVPDLATAS